MRMHVCMLHVSLPFFVNIQTTPTVRAYKLTDFFNVASGICDVICLRWRKYLEEKFLERESFFTVLTITVPFQVVWKCQYIFSIEVEKDFS